MNTKKYFTCLCLAAGIYYARAQTSAINYKPWMDTLHQNIYHYFYDTTAKLFFEEYSAGKKQTHSYLWPLCALIQAANEAEQINPHENYISPVVQAINQYYTNALPAPAYQASVIKEKKDDCFYDDNQWIAIAYLDIYNRTHEKYFLNVAKQIYDFMMTGYDTAAGGGLYWKYNDKTTKNTCSNGPGILVALQLYKITGDKKYLNTAFQLYNWVNAHLQAPDLLYYDNIKIPSLKIDSAKYTYNTGTILQSNVLLYNITHKKEYLQKAEAIADAARNFFYKNGKLPRNYWFNAVMLRGFIELYKVDNNKQALAFFYNDADRTWKDERESQNLLGRNANKKTLIDQAAMLEIYARLQKIK
jgi:uncharacterized protein YyaL (SSP411 family)